MPSWKLLAFIYPCPIGISLPPYAYSYKTASGVRIFSVPHSVCVGLRQLANMPHKWRTGNAAFWVKPYLYTMEEMCSDMVSNSSSVKRLVFFSYVKNYMRHIVNMPLKRRTRKAEYWDRIIPVYNGGDVKIHCQQFFVYKKVSLLFLKYDMNI